MLFWESKVIHKLRGNSIVPNLHFVGDEKTVDGKLYHIIVMDLLGKSLEELFTDSNRKFDLGTCLHLGYQMFERIKEVHYQRIIHRDIKPENFMIGRIGKSKSVVYLIDFGLAKYYVNQEGTHIPLRNNLYLSGTARYASLNTHAGYEQSRRDDLESICYVMLYFLRGSLPW